MTFLERQVERVSAATLSVESFASQLRSLQSGLEAATERVEQLARLVKLDQQYSDSVREEITRAMHSLQLQTQEAITPAMDRLDATESRLQRLEAAAREDSARRAAEEQEESKRRQQQEERERAMAAAVDQLRREAKERDDSRQDADRQLLQTVERSRHEHSSRHAALEERLTGLQSKADEESRQRRDSSSEQLSRLQQLEERLTAEQQSAAARRQREEALQHEVRETLRLLGDRQRAELLRNVEDLRRFQLEVRDEAKRRERRVETMRKALSSVCDELEERSAAGGAGSGSSSSRWRELREEEQREREEKDRRRLRHAAHSIRRELMQHVDHRIALLTRPARPSPSPYVHVGGRGRSAEEKEAEVVEEPDSGLQRLEQLIGLIRKPDADVKAAAKAKQSRHQAKSSRPSVSLRPPPAASRQSAVSARLSRTRR